MKKHKNNTAGFTLVEMMIVVMIFVIIIAMVMVMILTSNTTYHTANARISGQEDLRRALRAVVHEIGETNQFRCDVGTANQITFQIPVMDISGGVTNGSTVDKKNNIIFGARMEPTTIPDGFPDYAIRYVLVPNGDISNSNRLVRRVLNAYPNGLQVGTDIVLANAVRSVTYSRSGKTLSVNISSVKNNKFGRDMIIQTNYGITMRN